MPAKSEEQRRLTAMAEHAPEMIYAKNRGVLKMSHQQLHDFASTKGLPHKYARAVKHAASKKGK